MKVLFINNDGAGFAKELDVEYGTTVGELFIEQMGGVSPGDYLIRVNRTACSEVQVLKENDRVTVTPTKIEGA